MLYRNNKNPAVSGSDQELMMWDSFWAVATVGKVLICISNTDESLPNRNRQVGLGGDEFSVLLPLYGRIQHLTRSRFE